MVRQSMFGFKEKNMQVVIFSTMDLHFLLTLELELSVLLNWIPIQMKYDLGHMAQPHLNAGIELNIIYTATCAKTIVDLPFEKKYVHFIKAFK